MIKQMLDKLPEEKIKPILTIVRKELHTFVPNEKYRVLLSQYITYLLHDHPSQYLIDDIKKFWQEYGALLTAKENDAKFRSQLTNPTFGKDQLSAENLRYHQELKVGKNKNKGGNGLPIVDVAQVLANNPHLTNPIPEGIAKKHTVRDDDEYPGYSHEDDEDVSKKITDEERKIYNPSAWIGWNWVSLGKKSCGEEAAAAGHCGNAGGVADDNIVSLRDSKNRVHLTFILNNGHLGEAKGTNNDRPSDDYHPAIAALLLSGYVKHYQGGGYAPEANFHPSDFPEEVEHYILSHMEQLPTHKLPDNVWTEKAIREITQKEVDALPIDKKTSLLQSFLGRLTGEDEPWNGKIDVNVKSINFSIHHLIQEIRPHISPRSKIGIFVDAVTNRYHYDEPATLVGVFADDVIDALSSINSQAALSNFFQGLIEDHRGDQAAKTLRRMSEIGPLKKDDIKMVDATIRDIKYSRKEDFDISGIKDLMRDNLINGNLVLDRSRIPETTIYFNNPDDFANVVKHRPDIFGGYDFADNIAQFERGFATALVYNDAVPTDSINPASMRAIFGFEGLKKLQSVGKFDFNKVDHHMLLLWLELESGVKEELLKNKLLDLNQFKPADVCNYIGVTYVKNYYPEYFPKLQEWCRDQIYNHTNLKPGQHLMTDDPTIRKWNPKNLGQFQELFPKEEVDKMIYGGLVSPALLGWKNLKLDGYDVVKIAHAFNTNFDEMGHGSHDFFDALSPLKRVRNHEGNYNNKRDYSKIIQHVENGELPMKVDVYNHLPASYVFHWAMTHGEDPKILKNSIDRLISKTYLIGTIEGQTCLKENSHWSPYSISSSIVGSAYNIFHGSQLGTNFLTAIKVLGKNPYEQSVKILGDEFTEYITKNYVEPQIQNHIGLRNKDEFGIFFSIDQDRVTSEHDYRYVWTQTLDDFYKLFLIEYQKDPMFSEYNKAFMKQCIELEKRPIQWFSHLTVTLSPEQIQSILIQIDPRLKQLKGEQS